MILITVWWLQKLKTVAVCKQGAQKLDEERCNLKEETEPEVSKQYMIRISNRFGALENLNDSKDINST